MAAPVTTQGALEARFEAAPALEATDVASAILYVLAGLVIRPAAGRYAAALPAAGNSTAARSARAARLA